MYIEYGHGVETVKVKEYLDAVRTVNDLTLDLATHQISYKIKRFKIDEQLRLVGNHASDIRVQISRWRNGIYLSPLFKDIIPEPLYVKEFGTQAAGEQVGLGEKESHVMCPCPAGECRGFVTRRKHQCGVCGVKVCHKCLQAEDDDDDDQIVPQMRFANPQKRTHTFTSGPVSRTQDNISGGIKKEKDSTTAKGSPISSTSVNTWTSSYSPGSFLTTIKSVST
jgi:hypothetical protein